MEQLVNVKEISIIFKVGEQQVRRWLKTGKIIGQRIGRDYRIERAEIDYVRLHGLRTATRGKQIRNSSVRLAGRKAILSWQR